MFLAAGQFHPALADVGIEPLRQGADEGFGVGGFKRAPDFLLGGLAATNDLGKLPTLSTSGGNLVFTFVRDQASETGDVSAVIEVGTNLGAWPLTYPVPNDPVAANPGVTVVDNGNGTDTVTLTIPQSPDARKFARLNVVVQ